MRHKVFGKKLNRDIKERKALFRSLISSLIVYGRIKTTYAKAKAIGSLVEKLVTKAKDGSRSQVNQIASFLNRKEPVKKLVEEIAPRFKDKMGGFIRLIRLGRRQGDNADVVLMEWTVKEEPKKEIKEKKDEKPVNKDEKPAKKGKIKKSAKD
ncbi:50S ribosomal protein L17 [Candidatus Gottesmanbacteria bacterium RBG_16_37_8]|uniref:50S ribosomal protein L17 n=1 Tax=Candidatus Gottesmanbacteria bacterium RBG_16_37_8 TaxID=1798371 RepID=A0A1F5YV21_9BACT|nr:MAG: 50S ribosomal protein L17 [Candidatus Gottesmanbacteria bacterium RBG_16_37_8]